MELNCRGKLSIVVPVYNEENNIELLVEKISAFLTNKIVFEIIFVNDGSTDKTLENIKNISDRTNNIFYLSFSRNFGHQNALRAGIEHSTGDAVITMDGDLQHPPEILPLMIDEWLSGHDIVYTKRKDTSEDGWFKRITARWYYYLINLIANINLESGTADFRLLDKKVVKSLKMFSEKGIFYRGLIPWIGFKQTTVSYVPLRRIHGYSKYSIRKMVRLAWDGITAFSLFPLRAAAIVGLTLAFLSFMYVLYALYIKFFTSDAISGWLSVMAGVYLLGGIQLIFLGLCGEYIGRIFMEVKKRPNYILADTNLKELCRDEESND